MSSSTSPLFTQLRPLFQAHRIAVIGASRTAGRISHNVVRNLLDTGYRGTIFPVNPAGGEVLGLRCYRSLQELPDRPDCAMVVVAAEHVVQAVEDCAAARIPTVVVGAAGFAEAGTAEGRQREQALKRIAQQHPLRILGPNTNGFYNATDGLSLGYNAEHAEPFVPGVVSVVSHSGALFGGVARSLRRFGHGLSKFVPVGNEADLSMLDVLEYCIDDPATRVIALIIEALSSSARLRALAQRAHAAGKPIVAMKIGRSAVGAGAALAHSSRLAGAARAYDALFDLCGIASARSVESLAAGCAILAAYPGKMTESDRRLVCVTTSGAGGALLADYASERNLPLAGDTTGEWEGNAAHKIAALPASGHLRNPLDLGSLAGDWTRVNAVFEALEADGLNGPVAVYAHIAATPVMDEELATALAARKHRTDAPVVVIAPGGLSATIEARYRDLSIPAFDAIATGMDGLACYYAATARPKDPTRETLVARVDAASALLRQTLQRAGARQVLTELESAAILRAAGVVIVESQVVATLPEALKAASALGFPLVLKAIAPQISHKNALGFVMLNIRDDAALRTAYDALEQRVAHQGFARGETPLILQPMLSSGVELILGVSKEAELGHFLVFGLGGIHTEVLNQVSLAPLPISPSALRERLAESAVGKILANQQDSQGESPFEQLLAMLLALQALVVAEPERISSIDINPVLVTARRCVAVDALLVVAPTHSSA